MSRATPKMRAVAQRLIADEATGTGAPPAFGAVVEKLRQPLAALTGSAGFRSLLARALALTIKEVRWLRGVHVKADGSLESPTDMTQFDPEEITRGEVALLAQLLELLVTFIGESLTLRLVEDVWPPDLTDKLVSRKEQA